LVRLLRRNDFTELSIWNIFAKVDELTPLYTEQKSSITGYHSHVKLNPLLHKKRMNCFLRPNLWQNLEEAVNKHCQPHSVFWLPREAWQEAKDASTLRKLASSVATLLFTGRAELESPRLPGHYASTLPSNTDYRGLNNSRHHCFSEVSNPLLKPTQAHTTAVPWKVVAAGKPVAEHSPYLRAIKMPSTYRVQIWSLLF